MHERTFRKTAGGVTSGPGDSSGTAPGAPPPRRRGTPASTRRTAGAAWLVASWVLPAVLVPLRLGPVLAALLLLGVAASIRVGGGLLDRLMVSLLLVVGAVLALGLPMSVWPFGLSVPLTCSVLLTLAGLRWWVSGGLPRLPLRFRGSDLLIVGTFGSVLYLLWRPLAGLDPVRQLSLGADSADAFVHYSIFEAIQHIPGYLFLHTSAAAGYVVAPTPTSYPQGSHFFLAWFEMLLHGGRAEPIGLTSYISFFHANLVVLALVPAVVVWGTRWVAGPRLRGVRSAALLGGVGGLMLASPLVTLITAGYLSEVFGLLCLPLAVAPLVRPAMGAAERAAVVVTGATAVAYSYNVYAAVVFVAAAVLPVVHWRALRPVAVWWLPTVLLGLGLAALPSVYSVLTSLNLTAQAAIPGGGSATSPSLLFVVGVLAVVLLALIRGARQGTAVGRAGLLTGLASAGLLAIFGVWQLATVHALSYYYDKMATGTLLVALVLAGALGWLPGVRPRRAASRRFWQPLLAGATAGAVFLLALNVSWAPWGNNSRPLTSHTVSATGDVPLLSWAGDRLGLSTPPAGAFLLSQAAMDTHKPVIVLDQNVGWANQGSTYLANTLLGRGQLMGVWQLDVYYVGIGLGKPTPKQYADGLWNLEKALRAQDRPTAIWVAEPTLVPRLQRDLRRLVPSVPVTVRLLPPTPWRPHPLGTT